MTIKLLNLLVVIVVMLSGCAMTPSYYNEEYPDSQSASSFVDPVKYKASAIFSQATPKCIAVLPVTLPSNNEDIEITQEQIERLQWNLYSHLAPYPFRDAEITHIRTLLAENPDYIHEHRALSKKLDCDALLITELSTYQTEHFGFYSRSSIGVKMKLLRAEDGEEFWHGEHIARSHGGSFPLTPIGIAEGLLSATDNISEHQLVKVEDELFRRLLASWDLIPMNHQSDPIQLAEIKDENTSKPEQKSTRQSLLVAVKQLFLRSGPGTKFSAKDVLNENESLELVDEDNLPWVKVKDAKGQLGYVNLKYLSQNDLQVSLH